MRTTILKSINRITAAAAAFCMAASLCGCGTGGKNDDGDGGKLSVITTIYPAYDFACQVFGDAAEVTLLLKPGTESHTYDPSAKDVVKINSCDLFIYNGGESDRWVDSILEGTGDIKTLRMMDTVELCEEHHDEEEHDHSHETEEYDEHIWTSPVNAAAIVDAVEKAACEVSPENAELFKSNADSYEAAISDLDGRFRELFDGEERCFIFGDRFPLLYFFEEYGLRHESAFPGCGSEVEPSAQTISHLLERLSEEDAVKRVFCIELSNHKLADTLAEDSGLSVSEFHACHNITADDLAAGETYLTLMERNYTMLSEVLS